MGANVNDDILNAAVFLSAANLFFGNDDFEDLTAILADEERENHERVKNDFK